MTVEPGVYFNERMIAAALADPVKSKYLNAEKLKEYKNFGGIRIEDNILITETGHENLTNVPKETEDIEKVMAGK